MANSSVCDGAQSNKGVMKICGVDGKYDILVNSFKNKTNPAETPLKKTQNIQELSNDSQDAKPPDEPAPIMDHPTIENEKHQEPFKKNMKGDLFEITNYMVKNHVGLLT